MNKIFEGLKILDLSSVLAGPSVATFFAELGAQVTKIENKKSQGDITRKWRQVGETEQGTSAYYASVNWGKKVHFLDLNEPQDQTRVQYLIREADVVISNFKKGDDQKFALNYEEVKKLQPKVIYAHISGFGSNSDRIAYDLILQAESGFMSMNGQKEGPPTKMPLAMIDILAAHQLKEGILCAIIQQKDRPKSYKVEVSLYDSAIASLINQATNWLMNNNLPERLGSLHPNIAPYGEIFYTKDHQSITFAIGSDRQFEGLCQTLKMKHEFIQNYQTNSQRLANRKQLRIALQKKVENYISKDLLKELENKFVPAAQVKTLQEVFDETDNQLLLKEIQNQRPTIRPKTSIFKIL